jgi:hypothetical protein
MRKGVLRLSVVAVLMAPLAMMGLSTASASAAVTCSANKGSIKLSPGLTNTPKVQNIAIKGALSGCTRATVTGGEYTAHLKTVNAASCSALTSPGEGTTGTIDIKWSGAPNSMGSFTMPLTEVPWVSIGGTLTSGPFTGQSITGTVSETYTGGPACGAGHGKKKAKAVNKGTFRGSLEIS